MIVDAHLDLSMNALEWNRDLSRPLADINLREAHLTDKPDRGKATVSFEELKKGNVGLVVATQIARYVDDTNPLPGWNSPEQAWAQTQGQLAWYKAMEAAGHLRQITQLDQLEQHLETWDVNKPIGYILSLEGADSIIDISYLEVAYNYGLRAIGPAHYGPGRYAFGTHSEGPIGIQGKALLKEIERLGIILDATHLSDTSFWETMDVYNGPVWASHSLCRALVNDQRQFTDEQIKALVSRGAVIGGALDAWMMVPKWQRGISTPKEMGCSLDILVDHFDHICQLAGSAGHVALGTDLDGGFGTEQCPHDIKTIADLGLLTERLDKRGYNAKEIAGIMGDNWINFLRNTWQ